jgi:tetratricopeptide (TPR) repeat protein
MFKFLCVLVFSCGLGHSMAQSVGKIIDEAQKNIEAHKYETAIEQLNKVLINKPTHREALELRALCFTQTQKHNLALDDYKFLVNIKPKSIEYLNLMALCYGNISKWQLAVETLNKALEIDNRNIETLQNLALFQVKAKQYEEVENTCNLASGLVENNHYFVYIKALCYDSLRNFQMAAINYNTAIQKVEKDAKLKTIDKKNFFNYYYNLALVYIKLDRVNDAIYYMKDVLALDPQFINAYYHLGTLYLKRNETNKAIEIIDAGLKIQPQNRNLIFEKGNTYFKLNQFFSAIENYDKLLTNDSLNYDLRIQKAKCFEELLQWDKAINEYKKIENYFPENPNSAILVKKCIKKRIELGREFNKPILKITKPQLLNNNQLKVSVSKKSVEILGQIKDESFISKIYVDKQLAMFDTTMLNPTFKADVSTLNTTVTIKVVDIYNNSIEEEFIFYKSESNPPQVYVFEPLATSNNEIYLPKNANDTILIKGQIDDESTITSITVNSLTPVFSLENVNPEFEIKLKSNALDTIKITAKDKYNNQSTTNFTISRKASTELAQNPMGITWCIFIANSDYENFTSLDGPKNDLQKVKTALSNYRIDRFIEKNNMTKEEMEKFFSIEMRNLLKSTQVNSLIVWYAGHGKYFNDNGYWIPVNAAKGDEYSYFQITNLKGYISTYKLLQHVLVISDACETGPAFCNQNINAQDPGTCDNNPNITKQSAQVFTSSSSEQSADQSLFCETLCNTLTAFQGKCISIEKVKNMVINVVTKNQRQTPKFGSIAGLENSGGSFYFIKNK